MIRHIVIILSLVAFSSIMTGCAQRAPSAQEETGEISDASIVSQAQRRLASDPVTTRLRLGIQSDDGIVTMTGRIDNSAVRMRAISAIRGTPGVRGVIDKTVQF
jgi:osmotically-inducible protein OsmY